MRRGLRWVVAVALLSLMLPQARADDASKRAKVEELFTVMRLDRTMDQLVAAVRQQTSSMMRSMPGFEGMTPKQQKLVEEYQGKVSALVSDAVGWKALQPQMVTLYANTYSEDEVDGLLVFYKSAVGQTMLDKTPELTTKSLQLTQEKAIGLQPQIEYLMADFAKQFSAAGAPATAPKRPAPGTKPGVS